ncbi:hypothetical protein BFP97_11395 [Roseivirga sp. 4D4]|nr:hypothetical protein BFP97_11395 [Roseivirga sp. 4D4]
MFTGVLGVAGLAFLVIGDTDNPLMFTVNDYQFEEAVIFKPNATYNGVSYDSVTVTPQTYAVLIEDVPISKYLMSSPVILIALVLFYFLSLIIKLLKSIEEREFFSLANVKRLRIIGLMVIGSAIIRWSYSMILDSFLRNNFEIEGFSKVSSSFLLNFDFLDSLWFLGLMILLVANAFEHGVRLKEEQELTI